jgi:flagellar biosynthesis/type III secretory pathway M-ring protein FliF/YscJ
MWRLAVVFLVVMPAAALTALVVGLRYWTRQPGSRHGVVEADRLERRRVERELKQLEEQYKRQNDQEPGAPGS